jgi:type II secretory pathway component PulF
VLDLILARVADFMEKRQKLKARVRSAMVYPILVLTAAFTILLLLMKYVIPKFTEVLTDMSGGEALPKVTQIVLGVSNWIAYDGGWLILLAVPFGLIFLIKIMKQFRVGRLIVVTVKLRLPPLMLRVRRRVTRSMPICSATFTIPSGRAIPLPIRCGSRKPLT